MKMKYKLTKKDLIRGTIYAAATIVIFGLLFLFLGGMRMGKDPWELASWEAIENMKEDPSDKVKEIPEVKLPEQAPPEADSPAIVPVGKTPLTPESLASLYSELESDYPEFSDEKYHYRESRDPILVMGPTSTNFKQVLDHLQTRLGDSHQIHFHETHHRTGYPDFERALEKRQPGLLVLMDNSAADFYRKYQKSHQEKRPFPPAIATMSLNTATLLDEMENAEGIAYEVPVVISLAFLREAVQQTVEKVGVVYREPFDLDFERQVRHCGNHGFELVGYRMDPGKDVKGELIRGLNHLIKTEKVDALWLISDSRLLTRASIMGIWPRYLQYFKKPVIVGVKQLLGTNLGNFAVFPEPEGVGQQIIEAIEGIQARGGRARTGFVEEPRRLQKVLLSDFADNSLCRNQKKLVEFDVRLMTETEIFTVPESEVTNE